MKAFRRRFLRAAAVATALLAGAIAVPRATAAPAPRPNVLIFLLDDARTGTTGYMPRTDAWLRAGGTNFPEAVATTPSCGPSRSVLLSGRYAHNTGVTRQDGIGNLDHARTLQHDLRGAGYASAAIGKIFNTWRLDRTPPYFDRSALTGGGYENAHFVVDGVSRTVPYSTTFIGQQVNRYLDEFERDDARPWFVYAGFTAPHRPHTPEPRYAHRSFPWAGNPATKETDRSDKPAYVRRARGTEESGRIERERQLRTQLSVDDAIESIRAHLAARGELDNTLVVFTSDNGKMWGEHGLSQKFTPYVPSEQVPLLLWWRGRVAAGGTDRRLAGLVDIAPTILAAAGVAPSYTADGRSLLGSWSRSRILIEYWHDEVNGSFPTWASTYRPGVSQYTEYSGSGAEYYDLAADPWQLTNLVHAGGAPPLGPLSSTLAADRRCAGATCP